MQRPVRPVRPAPPSLDGISEIIAELYHESHDADKPQGLLELIMKMYRDLEASKSYPTDNSWSSE